MSKNKLFIIIIAVIVVIIAIVFLRNKENIIIPKEEANIDDGYSYDEESGLYYITNEETGEIRAVSSNKDDLKFYKENPDYNPNPLAERETDIKNFVRNLRENSAEEVLTEETITE